MHGSAPDIAGKNIANPVGAVLASALMLDHLGLSPQAGMLRRAVRASVSARQTTQDIGGSLGTREAGDWLAKNVTKQLA